MATSTITANFAAIARSEGRQTRQALHVIRAHSLRDEGGMSRHIVDANLKLLRTRMQEIRIKESLERCLVVDHGWNYAPICDYKYKQKSKQSNLSELVLMVGTSFSLTVLTGTLSLCLASILVHLNQ